MDADIERMFLGFKRQLGAWPLAGLQGVADDRLRRLETGTHGPPEQYLPKGFDALPPAAKLTSANAAVELVKRYRRTSVQLSLLSTEEQSFVVLTLPAFVASHLKELLRRKQAWQADLAECGGVGDPVLSSSTGALARCVDVTITVPSTSTPTASKFLEGALTLCVFRCKRNDIVQSSVPSL